MTFPCPKPRALALIAASAICLAANLTDAQSPPALAPNAAISQRITADRVEVVGLPDVAEPETAAADIQLAPDANSADVAATLLADRIDLSGGRDLTASGNVVIWYQGARLAASRIHVDGATGALDLSGPIHLSRPDEGEVLVADAAQLDGELQDGILRGARLVLARELQLAAVQAIRSDNGRLTRLDHVVASACQVCAAYPTPLWEIRAKQIVHDRETHRITFSWPQFRLMGVPIATLPWLSAPDPTVKRMRGFLRPSIRTTSTLGFGVKLPYFIPLGAHADLTLTPYWSASRTRTLELQYRQAFATGEMMWRGAVTRDDVARGETRGYLFGAGEWRLGDAYRVGFQVQTASDRAYLLDYDISTVDRLWSGMRVERVDRRRLIEGRAGRYQILRADETTSTAPTVVGDLRSVLNFTPQSIGGRGRIEWSLHAHGRESTLNQLGRDVIRGGLSADWQRRWTLPAGVVGAAMVGLDADVYRVFQDDRYAPTIGRFIPSAAVEFRWPLISTNARGTSLLEPVLQLAWSRHDDRAPNEDSRLIAFDEGNLFALNRAPGRDLIEGGLRANVGASWTRLGVQGDQLRITAGRVYRLEEDDGLGTGPLSGAASDWLLSTDFNDGRGFVAANRALFDNDFTLTRNELRIGWLRDDRQLSLGWLKLREDRGEDRAQPIDELSIYTSWQVTPNWSTDFDMRYDAETGRTRNARLGLQWQTDCLGVEADVSRRFTKTTDIRAETKFSLSVKLASFGNGKNDAPPRCSR